MYRRAPSRHHHIAGFQIRFRLAVKRVPLFWFFESIELVVRIRMRVPRGKRDSFCLSHTDTAAEEGH
jgi:hypothetical protein